MTWTTDSRQGRERNTVLLASRSHTLLDCADHASSQALAELAGIAAGDVTCVEVKLSEVVTSGLVGLITDKYLTCTDG